MLWEVAFSKMSYSSHRELLIPAIYSEAKVMDVEELKVLAWHAYWMYQQKAEEYRWREKIETDTPFEDPLRRDGGHLNSRML